MDFDLDDLGDSDDSFFQDPKVLKKRASLTKASESIFGLGDKTPKTEVDKPKATVTFEESTIKTDVVGSSVAIPTILYEKKHKNTDFLDDILSVNSKPQKLDKKISSVDIILKDSKTSTTSDRRRTRRGSTTIEDALGLFGEDFQSGDYFNKDKVNKNIKHPDNNLGKAQTLSDKSIPDWLDLNQSDISLVTKNESVAQKPLVPNPEQVENPKQPLETTNDGKSYDDISPPLNPQRINADIQNTYSSLYTQESLLLVSLQLKKYEESLMEIKNRQQEMLGKQEKQFNTLIGEYISKQQTADNNIRLQQERINNQIQMLLVNPISRTTSVTDHEHSEEHNENFQETRSLIKTIKQRHDEEMFIMEESYKKQITYLESVNATLEGKLRDEMTNMTKEFQDKIQTFKDKCNEDITYYRDKLKVLEEQHQHEIQLLKEVHSRLIDDIKLEHETQMNYIKQMKQREDDFFSDGRIFSQKLEANIETIHTNTKALQSMEEKVSKSYELSAIARENSIQTKEKEIILMKNSLEKCREAALTERSQLLALVRNLEVKLAEQNQNAREDRWALQEASATLTARAAAIEREAEYNRNMIEREREQLKTLKESLLTEQEKLIMKVTEEKLQISAEKSRLEITSKITHSYETEKLKSEAESAIQVAKELAEKVNQERNQLIRHKNELDLLKRNLADREREIEEKEVELEFLMQDAQRKLKEDKKVLLEAKKMENMYKERLQELQNQWIGLSNKEKKLTEEKVSLSKERLALYTSTKTANSCMLCKADKKMQYQTSIPLNNEEILTNKVCEVDILRFKMDAFDDTSEVSKEDNIYSNRLK